MSQNSVVEALRALAASNSKRSETSRLRAVLPEIEIAFAAGISRESMLETLRAQGFKLSLKTFDTVIWRLRKERDSGESKRSRTAGIPAAITLSPTASPQGLTPKEGQEEQGAASNADDDLPLTPQAKRERRASQFIKSDTTNPLLRRLQKDKDK